MKSHGRIVHWCSECENLYITHFYVQLLAQHVCSGVLATKVSRGFLSFYSSTHSNQVSFLLKKWTSSIMFCWYPEMSWLCVFSGRHSLYQVSWLHASSCSPSSFSAPHSWGETANTVRHRLQPAMNKPFKFLPLIIHFSRFSCLVTHFLSEVVWWYDWRLILYQEV